MFQQHEFIDEQSMFTAAIAALSHDEKPIEKISEVIQNPNSQSWTEFAFKKCGGQTLCDRLYRACC